MGCGASTPEPPRYVTPARAVQAGRAMPQPGAYSNYYAQAEAAFRAGDVNGDGVLDAQELYMVLVRLGFFNGVPPQNVQAMMEEQMARADSSVRDRKVTFDEFVPYFEYPITNCAARTCSSPPRPRSSTGSRSAARHRRGTARQRRSTARRGRRECEIRSAAGRAVGRPNTGAGAGGRGAEEIMAAKPGASAREGSPLPSSAARSSGAS